MVDHAVGECLLEFGDALVGDLGVKEDERMQIGQPLEMLQPRIGNLCAEDGERLQLRQSLEGQKSQYGSYRFGFGGN